MQLLVNGKRTILMISDHSDPLAHLGGEEAGGQNVYVHELSARLAAKGHTVHVVTRQNSLDRATEEEAPEGYTVFRVPLGPEGFMPKEQFPKYLPQFTEAIDALMNKHGYDVIHSHYWLSGVSALAMKNKHNIPCVHTFHSLGKVKHAKLVGIDPLQKKRREQYEKTIVKHADCLLAESPEERHELMRLYGASPERITVVPAGVDTNVFTPGNMKAARKNLKLHHKNVLLYVGRFVAQKGLPTLLQAYALMRSELSQEARDSTVLVLVGGDLTEKTEKQSRIQKRLLSLIASLDLEDAVHFAGQVDNKNLPTYYQAADMCIVPSRYEPFGIVPLEAMACGTPVVASFVGGMKSTVRNLYTGLHARPKNSADFARKMGILFKNPQLREEFGAQARQHIEQKYSWETVCDGVLSCYNATIATAPSHV